MAYHISEETRRKLSLARMGNTNNLGNKASLATRAKMSVAHIGERNAFFGRTHTEEARERIRQSRIGKPTTAGRRTSPATRLRISEGRKGISARSKTRSATYKALWANPDWAARRLRKIAEGRHRKPNKAELLLRDVLEALCPGDWRYVGDGSFLIGRLNPDFVNVNGRKQVIELFGEYWHKQEEEARRIKVFAEYGFNALVVWQAELADLAALQVKLEAFVRSECVTRESRASKGGNALGKCRDFTRSIPVGDEEKVQS